jgi:hypothetical protein
MARVALVLAICALLMPGRCSSRGRSQGGSELAGAPPDLCVIFVSGLRGRTDFLARRATVVDRARLGVRGLVQVDAGDLFPLGDPEEVERKGRVLLAAYARMGLDAITLGDHDLALGPDKLKSMAKAAGVSIVAANLVDGSGARVFESDRLIEIGTTVVGVFGLVAPAADVSASWSRQWGVTTLDPVTEARKVAASLRSRGARIVIGLFNGPGGVRRGAQISRLVGGVDVMVVSHSDGEGDRDVVRRPLAVQAGDDASQIGRIDVRLRRGRPWLDVRTLPLPSDVPDQLGVALTLRLAAGPVADAPTGKRIEHWTYASNEACGFCHKPELAQWQTTDHALAFATLKESGHGTDPACMGCHMTGFLRPGGTQFIQTSVEQMTDVGCECCHGPSAAHVGSVNKKKGTLRSVDPALCLGCHTPDQSVEPFDVVAAMKKILGPGHEARQNPRGLDPAK